MATFFLNFAVWMVFPQDFPFLRPAHFGILLGVALAVPALFFLGPALSARAAQKSLFGLVELSLGSVPAFCFRLCCVVYLVVWMAAFISVIVRWMLPFSLERDTTVLSPLFGVVLLTFLFATGTRGLRVSAKLALFDNKLGLALLMAALIRVRMGFPRVVADFLGSGGLQARGLGYVTVLLFYSAPLALFASTFGRRLKTSRKVILTGFFGLTLPLAASVLGAGFIRQAVYALNRNLGMGANIAASLWLGDARRFIPIKMSFAAMTMFGAVRFGAAAMADALPAFGWHKTLRKVLFVFLICITGWLSSTPLADSLLVREALARCLVAVAAVLTADSLSNTRRAGPARRVDWIGAIALSVGLSLSAYGVPAIYAASFLICLCGRLVPRRARSTRPGFSPPASP